VGAVGCLFTVALTTQPEDHFLRSMGFPVLSKTSLQCFFMGKMLIDFFEGYEARGFTFY